MTLTSNETSSSTIEQHSLKMFEPSANGLKKLKIPVILLANLIACNSSGTDLKIKFILGVIYKNFLQYVFIFNSDHVICFEAIKLKVFFIDTICML